MRVGKVPLKQIMSPGVRVNNRQIGVQVDGQHVPGKATAHTRSRSKTSEI